MKIVYSGEMEQTTFKDALGEQIPALCEKDEAVIYLDADLMSCIGTAGWAKTHPERAVNCGVAEANMVGVASGLAAVGFKPIVHTFGPFASRRCFDQVFLSAGYAGNDITVIGTDPGITATFNGGTHMPFEDIALYRTLPGVTVIDITDTAMLKSVLAQCVDRPGVKYIRVGRKNNAKVYADGSSFQIGEAIPLREGKDAVIFACGVMVHEALQAAESLHAAGVEVSVVDTFTIKPLDEQTVLLYAERTGAVVTAENHSRYGGLTSAVAETLMGRVKAGFQSVAVEDRFGEVGPQAYLAKQFGLTAAHIEQAVKAAIKQKRG